MSFVLYKPCVKEKEFSYKYRHDDQNLQKRSSYFYGQSQKPKQKIQCELC